jgi:hypothetical protein
MLKSPIASRNRSVVASRFERPGKTDRCPPGGFTAFPVKSGRRRRLPGLKNPVMMAAIKLN